jgi:hypothetical protein
VASLSQRKALVNKQAIEGRTFKRSFGEQIRQAQLERLSAKQKLALLAAKTMRL